MSNSSTKRSTPCPCAIGPAVETNGGVRSGAFVTELTSLVDMAGWGRGCRLICRRERPHPGAQLSIFDTDNGWRHTAFITNSPGDAVVLELRQRGHARVEDRVRCWKATGILNPPFEDYVRNPAWTAITLLASCLLAWTQLACLDGDLARAEPKHSATGSSMSPPDSFVVTDASSCASMTPGPGATISPPRSPEFEPDSADPSRAARDRRRPTARRQNAATP